MDFYQIKERSIKNGAVELYPDFKVCRSKDIMVRGRSFYAIWDEERGLWSTDEYDVQRIVDADLLAHKEKSMQRNDGIVLVKLMSDFSTKSWAEFRNYVSHISDNAHQLDENLTFANTDVKKKDYVSKRLPYPLEKGKCDAYEELMSTLYDPEERAKLEWSIGAIITGDSKSIQKFIVLYGEAGTGKSTVLNIIQKLFDGYYTTFEAKALTASSNAFATEVFKSNPLVAIQHDGDLSKIEDNSKLNSIVSHEEMTMNEKYKPSYTSRINSFLFMGTNRPVKITDAKSGIIRRLIDVKPSGRKVPSKHYQNLMTQIDFELGAIAYHCLEVYREMGKNYYANYRPLDMILQTDVFFNFVEANYYTFKEQDGVTLSQAYEMYKQFCDEAMVEYKSPRHKFREELKNYFAKFNDIARINGGQVRSYYSGFLFEKFSSTNKEQVKEEHPNPLVLEELRSVFDEVCATCPAQYASNDKPSTKWEKVTSTLADINTREVHYVKVPINHIVIDFDLKNDKGEKSLELNLEAASKWPPTYTEFSKSGSGIHLHYFYDGDVDKLSRVYADGIEIKVFVGNSSLRRKLTKCNNIPIATINSGLPLKGEKMINFDAVKSEKGLRDLIKRNLNKEIHPGTKPSIDFIHKILEDAYSSEMKYDITDMRPAILAFANNSSNQSEYCIRLVTEMKFKSEEPSMDKTDYPNNELVFYDVEVFPNLFIVVWKPQGKPAVVMINPTAADIEPLLNFKLVGFNCRRYDNHMLYARYIGYTIEQLYKLSQKIVNGSSNAMFGEAYNISYTDIYDFTTKKQGLKKWEIELGIPHKELGLPWDQPVPEELWQKVAEYCINDVEATEITFEANKQDYIARLILSQLSGLTPNDTTQQHTARIMFGTDPRPQDKFIYTDLSEMFPGYKFDGGKSSYRGEDPGEGGYVYAEPGMYTDVALIDVASMHPNSIINMNMFGPYTKRYEELIDARLAVKHGDVDKAKKLLGGILKPYLENPDDLPDLAYSLKIALNIVYGLTSAKFDNKFKDPRNADNIVAKRGALFMIDLKHEVQARGYTVAHIKTDSIKIPNATPEIIKFVTEFGAKYGYTFEHEATYEKMCLVNDAVYIAKYKDGKHAGEWTATGAQFAHPYVFKTLFTKEPIEFADKCETRAVSTNLYLDFNEKLPDVEVYEKEKDSIWKKLLSNDVIPKHEIDEMERRLEVLDPLISEGHNYVFVGKVGLFVPIIPGKDGGVLLREKEGKYHAAPNTKGYRWHEADVIKTLNREEDIDLEFFRHLVDDAVAKISKYGDFEWFIADDTQYPCDMNNGFGDVDICKSCKHKKGEVECQLGRDVVPF